MQITINDYKRTSSIYTRYKNTLKEVLKMIETRQLSFEDIKPQKRNKYMQILEIIGERKMTAREIEKEMNRRGYSKYFDMNHVRPRLTELIGENPV